VATTAATVPDVKATTGIHQQLHERELLPGEHYLCGCWCPPGTVLRWHRDLIARRHARRSRPRRPVRPPTIRSIRALVMRLTRENTGWG
jgi:hypothetical protein